MPNINIELGGGTNMTLEMNSTSTMNIGLGNSAGYAPIRDYELLNNKPQINSVTLIGNLHLADLFPDGIVIDGGDAEGVTGGWTQ